MSSDSLWITLQDTIHAQLALQVELSFDRHHGFMVEHGLSECRKVVDLGTGDGQFLNCIADRHPDITFYGIDDKPHMVGAAKSLSCPNVNWILADALDSATASLLEVADGIIMRYFLLHMPNTDTALAQILGVAQAGERLWVFDLDTDHTRCEPPQPAYDSFHRLVQDFCCANDIEIRTSSRLPPILERLGFEVEAISVEPFNNKEIDKPRLAEYLYREAMLYHYFLYGTPGVDELRSLKEFLDKDMDTKKHFVQYGMVMVSAVKRPL